MSDMLTVGSLFSGVGGIELGLERTAGFRTAFQVESDPYARRVLERHWPDVRRHDDVRTFPPGDPAGWRCDLLAGGDPCQGNSKAGGVHKRRHEDVAIHFLRIAGTLRPRFVLRENPASTRADAPWPWHRFRSGLEALGYSVLPFRLRACCLGLDHEGERLFLLAELPEAAGERLEGFDGAGEPAGDGGGAGGRRVRDGPGDRLPASRVCRGVDRIPDRVDRTRCLGNALPPAMSEWIGRLILHSLGKESNYACINTQG